MVVYKEPYYGADADGNRGVSVLNAEIEPSDAEEIKAQLEMMYDPEEILYTIFLYDHTNEIDHEFEVNINDYLTPIEIKGLT